jgi:hypothetical protein
MNHQDVFVARLADHSVLPTLICGHCNSMLSKTRVFVNEGEGKVDVSARIVAYCSADDCGAVNCCDEALRNLDEAMALQAIAS